MIDWQQYSSSSSVEVRIEALDWVFSLIKPPLGSETCLTLPYSGSINSLTSLASASFVLALSQMLFGFTLSLYVLVLWNAVQEATRSGFMKSLLHSWCLFLLPSSYAGFITYFCFITTSISFYVCFSTTYFYNPQSIQPSKLLLLYFYTSFCSCHQVPFLIYDCVFLMNKTIIIIANNNSDTQIEIKMQTRNEQVPIVHGLTPGYNSEMLSLYEPNRPLRSSCSSPLTIS